jgi:hypothetical protein
MIMEGDPFLLIEGMTIAGLAVGATMGYIYVRSEYPHAIAATKAAIAIARKARLLGANLADSGKTFDLEVRTGAGAYVCGEETALLESLEGRRGLIVCAADGDQQRADADDSTLRAVGRRQNLCRLRHGPFTRNDADPACGQHPLRRAV